MPVISAISTEVAGSTSDVIANVGSTTRRLELQQLLGAQFTAQGQMPFAAAADISTFLAAPTSGAVLTYSSGSSIPAWSIPTSGAIFIASSISVPTWLALGTSGQVLQTTGGRPSWVTPSTESCIVGLDSTFNLPTGAVTAIDWSAETIDASGMHSTVTASSRIDINTTGLWFIGGSIGITASTVGRRALIVAIDGTNTFQEEWDPPRVAGVATYIHIDRLHYWATTGNLVISAFQDIGSTLNATVFNSRAWAHRLS